MHHKNRRSILIFFCLMLFSTMSFAQDRTQTGSDETQVPERVDVRPEAEI
ncbi:hypothetical protein BH23BAC3_BH23BAC3_23230 [soil metagenome]